MCNKPVNIDSSSLQYVPDWFITRDWVDMEVIGMMIMKINFLSGTMGIKSKRFKKQK